MTTILRRFTVENTWNGSAKITLVHAGEHSMGAAYAPDVESHEVVSLEALPERLQALGEEISWTPTA